MAVRFADVARASFSPADGPATGLIAGAGVAAIAVAALANPATIEDGPTLCPFRLLTGLPCPGCGLTRSWVYLVHGDWPSAFAANLFGPVAFAAVCLLVVAVLANVLRSRPAPSLAFLMRSWAFWAVSGGWLAYAALRLVLAATGREV